MSNESSEDGLTQAELVDGLRALGLGAGDVVFVQSAMRTFGPIAGGAETVVAALMDVLGDRGTLVVPTFTFKHEAEDDPIIDPANDRSEMGAITEAVRTRPDARRSTAYRHSFAAVGRRADVITDVNPSLPVFDLRSVFGVMLALNTKVLLLGLDYHSSTSHHFAEWLCDVPYRHTLDMTMKVRGADGTIVEQPMLDYQPRSDDGPQHSDFNRLGQMMEDGGMVAVGALGNCVARCYSQREMVELAQQEAKKDYDIFRNPEGQGDWVMTTKPGTTVVSPDMLDGAGRDENYHWCVVDPARLELPNV
jgi:aminoglycoside 3-N-acetyltransferase